MLALLPVAALCGLVVVLRRLRPSEDARRIFLRACVVWGIYLVVATEALSLVRGLTPLGLSVTWGAALAALLAVLLRVRAPSDATRVPSRPRIPSDVRPFWLGVVVILGVTALVTWLAPPQTWDSLNYHMPRVAHWAQQASLRPFATGIEVQNSRTPGAEYIVLHFYVLGAGDRLANFAAWLGFLGCAVGAGLLAAGLGGGRAAQGAASLVAAAIPMAIVQASSTMTDGLAAFWCLCFVVECRDAAQRLRMDDAVWLAGLSAGLAMLTKPTAAPFLAPFALWLAYRWIRGRGLIRTAAMGLAIGLVAAALSAGHWSRNLAIYGRLLDPEQVAVHSNQVRDLRGLVSNLLRNLALNAGTPSPHVNKGIYLAVAAIHDWIGLDPSDPRTTSAGEFKVRAPSTHEDLTSNPWHAWLYLFAGIGMLSRRKPDEGPLRAYLALMALGFLLLSGLFKWQIFGNRYQLPFFVLMAPVAAVFLQNRLSDRWLRIAAVGVAIGSLPWLLGIRARPLIALPGSDLRSILTSRREDLYFANGPYLQEPYRTITELTRQAGCDRVGLLLPGNEAEYPLWVLLGAPRPGLQIEWIVSGTASARFEDPSFEPCAAICVDCPTGWSSVRGLGLNHGTPESYFRLYLGSADEHGAEG